MHINGAIMQHSQHIEKTRKTVTIYSTLTNDLYKKYTSKQPNNKKEKGAKISTMHNEKRDTQIIIKNAKVRSQNLNKLCYNQTKAKKNKMQN